MLCNKEFEKEMEKVSVKYFDVLEALQKYEEEGKVSKLGIKKRFNFTISDDVMKKFKLHCYKENKKMSSVIEEMIKEKINN